MILTEVRHTGLSRTLPPPCYHGIHRGKSAINREDWDDFLLTVEKILPVLNHITSQDRSKGKRMFGCEKDDGEEPLTRRGCSLA